jgi:uncharacterized membrane protein
MSNYTRWLRGEIPQWKSESIITPEQADRLLARYESPAGSKIPWGLLVFASTGAIVIGLGVILLFAYNWDDIPKFGKLALIFGAIIAAHVAGVRLHRSDGWKRTFGEAMSILGTMFYGAGIWLVAQIYHIDEHYPDGFLWWALGALAIAWAIRSTAHGLVVTILLVIWGVADGAEFSRPSFWAIALLAAGVGSLAWKNRSALLLTVVLIGLQILIPTASGSAGGSSYALTASLAWGAVLVAAARLLATRNEEFTASPRILALFGYGGFLSCCYILTFVKDHARLLEWNHDPDELWLLSEVFGWAMFAVGTLAWARLAYLAANRRATAVTREDWLVPIGAIYAFGLAATRMGNLEDLVSWIFTIALLGLAITWMWRGCRQSDIAVTVTGSALLSALVLARYFDLFETQAARGVAFIVLGAIFVVEALYYRRMKREEGSS